MHLKSLLKSLNFLGNIRLIIIFVFGVMLAFNAFSGSLVNAQAISANKTEKNQLILKFNSAFRYHYFYLTSPDRLVIDFSQTGLQKDISKTPLGTLPISSLRTSFSSDKTLRVVLDLKYRITPQSKPILSVLSATRNEPWRLKVAFGSVSVDSFKSGATSATKPVSSNPQKSSTPALNVQATYRPHTTIIVIDAGHGGKDPGAHGSRYGTKEKDVVLGIARQLQYLISREPGMHPVMTRNGDYFIDLRRRLTIARKNKADLFVSIHADAFSNIYSHGASVYALSERGGTSEAARWLAAKENYSELGGVNLGALDDDDGMVRSVLIDLSQTATIGASLELGSGVLRNIGQMTRLHHNSVEQAQFVVLKSLDIPSILVETGFISNPQEEANLRRSAYQAQLARAILLGIKSYLKQHPSTGAYQVGKQ